MKSKISWGVLAVVAVSLIAYFALVGRPSANANQVVVPQAVIAQTGAISAPTPAETVVRPLGTQQTSLPAAAANSVREEKLAQINRSIDSYYGKAMQGLGLTPTQIEKLHEFLVAKAEAGYIAQDVVATTPGGTATDVLTSAKDARAQVDDEIRQYFGDEKYAQIQLMQDGVAYLGVEQRDLAPALEKAGVPQLSPEQALKFAAAMAEANGRGINVTRPTWTDSATGLTNRDLPVIEKAAGFLSPEQIAVLQTILAARNRK